MKLSASLQEYDTIEIFDIIAPSYKWLICRHKVQVYLKQSTDFDQNSLFIWSLILTWSSCKLPDASSNAVNWVESFDFDDDFIINTKRRGVLTYIITVRWKQIEIDSCCSLHILYIIPFYLHIFIAALYHRELTCKIKSNIINVFIYDTCFRKHHSIFMR